MCMLSSPTAFVVSAIFVAFLEDRVRSSNWHGHDIAKFGKGMGRRKSEKRERRWGRREMPLRNGVEKGRQTVIDGIFNFRVGPSGEEYLVLNFFCLIIICTCIFFFLEWKFFLRNVISIYFKN